MDVISSGGMSRETNPNAEQASTDEINSADLTWINLVSNERALSDYVLTKIQKKRLWH